MDEQYLFSIKDEVENASGEDVTLHSYGLVSRLGTPTVLGFFVLHEGLVGYLGEDGLQEIDYDDLQDDVKTQSIASTNGWLGITDKYWAVTLIPDQAQKITARFSNNPATAATDTRPTFSMTAGTAVPDGGTAAVTTRRGLRRCQNRLHRRRLSGTARHQ